MYCFSVFSLHFYSDISLSLCLRDALTDTSTWSTRKCLVVCSLKTLSSMLCEHNRLIKVHVLGKKKNQHNLRASKSLGSEKGSVAEKPSWQSWAGTAVWSWQHMGFETGWGDEKVGLWQQHLFSQQNPLHCLQDQLPEKLSTTCRNWAIWGSQALSLLLPNTASQRILLEALEINWTVVKMGSLTA